MYNVLFICRANSARSIMAEALLNKVSDGRFHAYSAGSEPAGQVHPITLQLLESAEIETQNLRSKSWDEFSGEDAPELDLIITLCDDTHGEVCPVWSGHPVTSHWGIEDPLAEGNVDDEKPFHQTLRFLENRILLMLQLPMEKLEHLSLKQHLDEIAALEKAGE